MNRRRTLGLILIALALVMFLRGSIIYFFPEPVKTTTRKAFQVNDVIYSFKDGSVYRFQGFNGSQIVIGDSVGGSVYVALPTFRFELQGKIFDVLAWDKTENTLKLEFWPYES